MPAFAMSGTTVVGAGLCFELKFGSIHGLCVPRLQFKGCVEEVWKSELPRVHLAVCLFFGRSTQYLGTMNAQVEVFVSEKSVWSSPLMEMKTSLRINATMVRAPEPDATMQVHHLKKKLNTQLYYV